MIEDFAVKYKKHGTLVKNHLTLVGFFYCSMFLFCGYIIKNVLCKICRCLFFINLQQKAIVSKRVGWPLIGPGFFLQFLFLKNFFFWFFFYVFLGSKSFSQSNVVGGFHIECRLVPSLRFLPSLYPLVSRSLHCLFPQEAVEKLLCLCLFYQLRFLQCLGCGRLSQPVQKFPLLFLSALVIFLGLLP